MPATFVVARNPEPDTSLPYLLKLPIDGGLVLKAREPWPIGARVYCHPFEGDWPDEPDVVEEVGVRQCRRRGSAIDLVLDRSRNNRAQFVFTQIRARPAIFMQTAKVIRKARPGVRVPRRKPAGLGAFEITVDVHERYGYRFAGRSATVLRGLLPAGDYAVVLGDTVVAAVERKTMENLTHALVDGSLGFQMSELAGLPAAAVVVEDRFSALFKADRVQPGWLPELVARLQVRYPNVPIVFCETRKLAEEWTYRFLAAARAELGGPLESSVEESHSPD